MAARSLPKPVGILTPHDRLALQLLDLCHSLGLDVPGEVATVGVDNEELVCESSWPTLSSVALPGEQLEMEAARLLQALMAGKRAPRTPLLLPPVGVVTRQSSDAIAVKDPIVANALRFIREHQAEPIHVADVLRHLPVNRRTFERQFQATVGRSPLQEILRLRLERAKHLLATTDLPMPEISQAAGFRDAGHFWETLRRACELSPRAYRQRYRTRT